VSEPGQDKPHHDVGHRIVRAMFVIIFFQLFWKFGGLIVTILVGSIFASGPEADAYTFVSKNVVFLLQTFCLKVFIPLLVPLFKEELAEHGEEGAWRFANTVLNLTIVALAATVVAAFVFAPQVLSLFAPGFNEQQLALSARLMRWMLPGVFAVCLATVTYAVLNSYNVFGYAAAGDGVQKLVWAGALFAASLTGLALPRMLDALAVGFVISAGAMLLTHLLGLRSKLRFYRPSLPGLSLRRIGIEVAILAAHLVALGAGLLVCERLRPRLPNDGALLALQQVVLVAVVSAYLLLLWWRARGRKTRMARFATLAVPLLFGILFAKYRDLVTSAFASFTGTGVFADLEYARKVGEAPNTLVIAALSIALLPHLSELAAKKLWGDFARVMTKTIRVIIAFFVPLTALMIVLRQPIIALLFDRGNWTDYHLKHAGDALGLYILALPFFAIENPIQQSFFAMQRMWAPTIIGFLGTGFHILFLFIGIEWLGFGYFIVVAIVYAAARAVKNIILLLVMRYHVRILPWRPTLIFLAKAAIATAGVWAAAEFTYRPLTKLLPLDPYRRREVMIDTFNVELRDWEADNVDDFRIVCKSNENDAALLKEAFGTTDVIDGQNALMARYRRSPRRFAGLRRDLSDFAMDRMHSIFFVALCNEDAELTVELVARDGRTFRHEPLNIAAGKRQFIAVKLREFGLGKPRPELVGLWIRDTTPTPGVRRDPSTLILRAIRVRIRGEVTAPLDNLEPTPEDWSELSGHGDRLVQVEDTGERAGEPEFALHFPKTSGGRLVGRYLEEYGLRDCERLTFKARADAPCSLKIGIFTGTASPSMLDSGERGADPGAADALKDQRDEAGDDSRGKLGVRVCWEKSIAITASSKRKTYSVPLSAFKPQPVFDTRQPPPQPGTLVLNWDTYLEFDVPPGVDFWLDNVAFVREAKGPRLGRVAVMYEVGKLIHVAVPSLAAVLVFVVLLFVLRVEEAREGWEWVREKGLRKIVGKFRRRKGQSVIRNS